MMGGAGGLERGGEGAKVVQGLHDSRQNLVVVQTFSVLRLSRGQPPHPSQSVLGGMLAKYKNGHRGRLAARRGPIPVPL